MTRHVLLKIQIVSTRGEIAWSRSRRWNSHLKSTATLDPWCPCVRRMEPNDGRTDFELCDGVWSGLSVKFIEWCRQLHLSPPTCTSVRFLTRMASILRLLSLHASFSATLLPRSPVQLPLTLSARFPEGDQMMIPPLTLFGRGVGLSPMTPVFQSIHVVQHPAVSVRVRRRGFVVGDGRPRRGGRAGRHLRAR